MKLRTEKNKLLYSATKNTTMKFIHYIEKISGISIYGISSFLLFSIFFLIMLIWALKADKNMIEELRQIPLDGSQI